MIKVWWTVPGAHVAWEWHPTEAKVITCARERREDGYQVLIPAATWQPQWTDTPTPTGQPFADLTALFCAEANIRPRDVVVTWLSKGIALTWSPATGSWQRHVVAYEGTMPVLSPGIYDKTAPTPRDAKKAADIAMRLLTQVST